VNGLYFDMCFFDADTPSIEYLDSNLPFIKGKTPRLSLLTIIIPKPFCSLCIESYFLEHIVAVHPWERTCWKAPSNTGSIQDRGTPII
jgi:hypothetical protein